MQRQESIVVTIASLASIAFSAHVHAKTWNGAAAEWSDGTQWTPAGEPGIGDNADFTAGTAQLGAGEVAANVNFNSGAPVITDHGPTAGVGDLTISGALSRFLSGQSELTSVVVSANSVVLDNTGSTGNNATILVRSAGSTLNIGAGGLSMNGYIDTAGQRTARLGFRSSATSTVVLGGNVTVNGFAAFSNASAFTNDVQLNGIRTFTVNIVDQSGVAFDSDAVLTVANIIPSGQFTSAGSVRLTDNGATAGGVIKAGTGTMEIFTASAYTGGTTVNAGTLFAAAEGSLGTGDVTVNSGALTLGTGAAIGVVGFIADTAAVSLASVNADTFLNFTGTDIVGSLTLDGVPQGAGIYGATALGGSSFFSGSGTLTVIPEPTTLALACVVGLMLGRRRRVVN